MKVYSATPQLTLIHILPSQVGAVSVHVADWPFLVQILLGVPPVRRYPLEQE